MEERSRNLRHLDFCKIIGIIPRGAVFIQEMKRGKNLKYLQTQTHRRDYSYLPGKHLRATATDVLGLTPGAICYPHIGVREHFRITLHPSPCPPPTHIEPESGAGTSAGGICFRGWKTRPKTRSVESSAKQEKERKKRRSGGGGRESVEKESSSSKESRNRGMEKHPLE